MKQLVYLDSTQLLSSLDEEMEYGAFSRSFEGSYISTFKYQHEQWKVGISLQAISPPVLCNHTITPIIAEGTQKRTTSCNMAFGTEKIAGGLKVEKN